jgi:hypothetical protein
VIAALFVQKNGHYFGLEGVDPWDEERDARLYSGPHAVVAHPPCARWCRLAGLVEKRWGHKKGEDGGCFEAALRAVRSFGGVLEHPAYTDAWKKFGLTRPPKEGGWVPDLSDWLPGGWVCHVEQGHYGHRARKATWLYAVGCTLPDLKWGPSVGRALTSWCGNHVPESENRPRLGKKEASQTPLEFRDELIAMARSVYGEE